MNESNTENDTLEVSKSQRKREANELLELAKKPDIDAGKQTQGSAA